MATKWRLSGSLLGECNCNWGCPCSFDAPPTNGRCEGVYTWFFDEGVYGSVKLGGLALAIPGTWPSAVHLGHGTSVLVVDKRADAEQRKA